MDVLLELNTLLPAVIGAGTERGPRGDIGPGLIRRERSRSPIGEGLDVGNGRGTIFVAKPAVIIALTNFVNDNHKNKKDYSQAKSNRNPRHYVLADSFIQSQVTSSHGQVLIKIAGIARAISA